MFFLISVSSFFSFVYCFKNTVKPKCKAQVYNIPLRRNTEEQYSSVTIMISVGGKGTVFPVKWTLEDELVTKARHKAFSNFLKGYTCYIFLI